MQAAGPAHNQRAARVWGGECGGSLRFAFGAADYLKICERNGRRNPLIGMKTFLFRGRDAADS